jgi:hypothetical protein
MTAAFKHLKPHEMPPTTKTLGCLAIAPPVQAIIVDSVSVVNP